MRIKMADGVGFEPTMGLHPCRFSRPVHSTALPSLRICNRDALWAETTHFLSLKFADEKFFLEFSLHFSL